MLIFDTKKKLKQHLSGLRQRGKSIGLVPTMGALHKGHLSLVEASLENTDITVVTIFVNAKQFDNQSDFAAYPTKIEEDKKMLEALSVDILFAPSHQEIYDSDASVGIHFGGLQTEMEGAHRKGHFEGVGIVVAKFFNIIAPDKAFFGEKDFQQLRIIKALNHALSFDIDIVGVDIKREDNGLAMSSRNERLSAGARKKAGLIFESLSKAAEMLASGSSLTATRNWFETLFKSEREFDLEYFEIANPDTLCPINKKDDLTGARLFVAVHIEGVRLIDNLALERKQ